MAFREQPRSAVDPWSALIRTVRAETTLTVSGHGCHPGGEQNECIACFLELKSICIVSPPDRVSVREQSFVMLLSETSDFWGRRQCVCIWYELGRGPCCANPWDVSVDVMAPFSPHRPMAMCLRTRRNPSTRRAQPEHLLRRRPRWGLCSGLCLCLCSLTGVTSLRGLRSEESVCDDSPSILFSGVELSVSIPDKPWKLLVGK